MSPRRLSVVEFDAMRREAAEPLDGRGQADPPEDAVGPDPEAQPDAEPALLAAPTAYAVPTEGAFGGKEFLLAHGIEAVAGRLIEAREPLNHLRVRRVLYLWKRKAGELSHTARASGLVGWLATYVEPCEYVVWLSASACREAELTDRQLEALTYHALLHTGVSAPDLFGDTRAVIRAHEFEGFAAEVDSYGLWSADLRQIAAGVSGQLPLDAEPPEDEDDEQDEDEDEEEQEAFPS